MIYAPGRVVLVIALLVGALCSAGCFQGMAEDQVRKTLTRLLGPAEKYEIHIANTSDSMLLGGEVRDLSINAKRVATRDGLVIQRFDVRMHGLKLDKAKKKVESVQTATFDLDILQEDLSTLACRKVQKMGDVQVLVAPGEVAVVMPARALGQALDLSVRGGLSVDEGVRIVFRPNGISVGPLSLNEGLPRMVLERINPIADLSKLPIPVYVERLVAGAGVLSIHGQLFRSIATGP